MNKLRAMLFLLALMAVGPAHAQTPTGAIAGGVTDPAGAPLSGASISIINRDRGLTRKLTTSTEGAYSAAALPSGVYLVTAEAAKFRLLERTVTVEAGT